MAVAHIPTRVRALFVTNHRHVGDAPGGVQTCSREYLDLLDAAGLNVDILRVDVDRGWVTRLKRLVRTSPYIGALSLDDAKLVQERACEADVVFLNQVALSGGLPAIDPDCKLRRKTVLLSHGAEVTDLLNFARARVRLPLSGRLRPWPMQAVRNVLSDEIRARQGVAGAVCLSSFDADFERWLGVTDAIWVPRTVASAPLDWQPVPGRFGFLGTLDHAPNLEGLVETLDALVRADERSIELRVVGGPESLGRWLLDQFPHNVSYLGPLIEEELRREAASWSAFLNPIYCQARGCSTKLATALSWEIPVITTVQGRRGYINHAGEILVADNPNSFVRQMMRLIATDDLVAAQREIKVAARSMPDMQEVALQFIGFLRRINLFPDDKDAPAS